MGNFRKINSFLFMVLLALVLTPLSAYAADNVLTKVAGKSLSVLQGARGVVYVLGGFGLVMFAFMAIFGKTNWKHFSYIGIGLFLVASMGMFVDYFTGSKGQKTYSLQFGDHIKGVYADTSGTDNTIPNQDAEGGGGETLDPNNPGGGASGGGASGGGASGGGASGGGASGGGDGTDLEGGESTVIDPTGVLGPDGKMPPLSGAGLNTDGMDLPDTLPPMDLPTGEDSKKGGGKLSFKDIIQSGKDALNAGHEIKDAVNTGKNTVKDVVHHVDDVKDAWKNADGIGGIFDAIMETGSSIGQASDSVVNGGKNIAGNASGAAGAVSDIGKNQEQREDNKKKKDDTGGANKVDQWLNNQGQDALDTADKIQDKIAGAGSDLSSVGELGAGAQSLAGKGVGGAIGAAGAVGAVVGGVVDSAKKNKDEKSTSKISKEEAAKKQKDIMNSLGVQSTGVQPDGRRVDVFYENNGSPIVRVAQGEGFVAAYSDGSKMVSYPNGSKAKFDKDGAPTTAASHTDKEGVKSVYNSDGTVSVTRPGGAVGTTRSDGKTEYVRKDGNKVVVDKNGVSGVLLDANGKEIGSGYLTEEDYY